MDSAVSCAGLTKRYGSVVALDQLTLDAPTGSIFGLLGPNGAGKSTLIRLLTGQAAPTAGSAQVLGLDVTSAGMALSKRISVLDQGHTTMAGCAGVNCCRSWANYSACVE